MKNFKKFVPSFEIENQFGDDNVCGIDEAGRGPLAGPVVACCVLIDKGQYFDEKILQANDSKKLSKKKRSQFYDFLIQNIKFHVAVVDNPKIDEVNILNATKLAMRISYQGLLKKYNIDKAAVLVDGNINPFLQEEGGPYCKAIVKGDQKSISIACASIIAKEFRDDIMRKLHEQYPAFDWDSNSGYPTKKHIENIEKYGVTCYHRASFAPIKNNNYKKYQSNV